MKMNNNQIETTQAAVIAQPTAEEFTTADPLAVNCKFSLTAAAMKRVNDLLQDAYCGLRIVIKKTGCSGISYKTELVQQPLADDLLFTNQQALNIYVSAIDYKKHGEQLNGITLDYVTEGLNKHFKFINPKAKGVCGCGESFSV